MGLQVHGQISAFLHLGEPQFGGEPLQHTRGDGSLIVAGHHLHLGESAQTLRLVKTDGDGQSLAHERPARSFFANDGHGAVAEMSQQLGMLSRGLVAIGQRDL